MKILIVLSDASLRLRLHSAFADQGFAVESADSGVIGLVVLLTDEIHALVTEDIAMATSGATLVEECAATRPGIPILVIQCGETIRSQPDATPKQTFYFQQPLDIDAIIAAAIAAIS